ncbi:MAG: response regulator transcription factor [Verrucomicrobiales bacterium]|nr:response regulator transcription factor [Verrucomicrobiales bacterium]
MRILVVEDEEKVAGFLAEGLREQAFAVDLATDGEEGIYRALNTAYDLILLDVMLPKRDGFSVLRALRQAGQTTRVMMLTARDAVADRVHGLNEGADDYLPKPFDFDELLARIAALLRRPPTAVAEELWCADLRLNRRTREVVRGDLPIEVSAKQFAVLEYLMLRKNEVVDRSQLAEHAWDEDLDPLSNVIDVTVHHLRSRIDKGHHVRLLHTVRGVGYVLREGKGT